MKRRNSPAALAAALALASTTSSLPDAARAQTEGPQGRALTLQEALAKALENNKELAAFEYRLEAQDGRVRGSKYGR